MGNAASDDGSGLEDGEYSDGGSHRIADAPYKFAHAGPEDEEREDQIISQVRLDGVGQVVLTLRAFFVRGKAGQARAIAKLLGALAEMAEGFLRSGESIDPEHDFHSLGTTDLIREIVTYCVEADDESKSTRLSMLSAAGRAVSSVAKLGDQRRLMVDGGIVQVFLIACRKLVLRAKLKKAEQAIFWSFNALYFLMRDGVQLDSAALDVALEAGAFKLTRDMEGVVREDDNLAVSVDLVLHMLVVGQHDSLARTPQLQDRANFIERGAGFFGRSAPGPR